MKDLTFTPILRPLGWGCDIRGKDPGAMCGESRVGGYSGSVRGSRMDSWATWEEEDSGPPFQAALFAQISPLQIYFIRAIHCFPDLGLRDTVGKRKEESCDGEVALTPWIKITVLKKKTTGDINMMVISALRGRGKTVRSSSSFLAIYCILG